MTMTVVVNVMATYSLLPSAATSPGLLAAELLAPVLLVRRLPPEP
jgi:hypothetical protein